jgi:serine/threonine protein kinase
MIGSTIGHYTIETKLGEGGMGVVYKATDTKLDRAVALKFLPEHVTPGSADLERFVQEAKAAAALNHPNICTVFGIDEADTKHFIVMEFVDGQMLSEKASSLSMKQAIDIGIQIGEGLAAAHEKGIVHRDIKPENIMIRKDGIVQIMDFGLAKLRGASRLTKEGSTVGTAGYMSPEQVQGQDTDHRSDIFSLGVLLYEMLSGQPPFKGMHETAIAYEIVNVDSPPMSSLKPEIPAELDAIVLDCLDKDPNERSQSAKQIAIDLKRYKRDSSKSRVSRMTAARPAISTQRVASDTVTPGSSTSVPKVLPWSVAGVAIVIAIALAMFSFSSEVDPPLTIQAQILAPEGTNYHSYGVFAGPAVISPDGNMLAFGAMSENGTISIYLRAMDEAQARPIAGTEGGSYPFWSHDSRSIAFISTDGRLKRVDVVGNPPTTIAAAANGLRGAWSKDDVILFSTPKGPLMKVSALGGTSENVTEIDTTANEGSHRWPSFLPDGKHFIYFSRKISYTSDAEGDAIMLGSLDGDPPKLIMQSSSDAVFASGHILFMRGSTLLAQRFDENSLSLAGDPTPIAEGIINDPGFSLGVFSASQNGILTYQTGTGSSGARMVIVDRAGVVQQYVGEVNEHYTPSISPDGKKIVVDIFEPRSRTQNLWMYDMARRQSTRFTSGNSIDLNPVWSPDGDRIAYMAITRQGYSIRIKPLASREPEETIHQSSSFTYPTDWSPDGSVLLITQIGGNANNDILQADMDGGGTVSELLNSKFNEGNGMFSPDGRWIAYESNETGKSEIYVRPYPGPGSAVKVSESEGYLPHWNSNGRELFYVDFENKNRTMSAEIRTTRTSIDIGTVKTLFARTKVMFEYDVFPGSNRFLVNRNIEPAETDPLTIVVNWTEKLKSN